ncbi:MAG TPA: cytochrome P450 [Solirubrobacteraceae bacterium]
MATTVAPPISSVSQLPRGPQTPLFLNGLLFLFARSWLMGQLARRYGDAYTIKLPMIGTVVAVSHPDLVKAVYTASPTVLHAGKNPLGEILGPGSLFSMDEERHLKERRMLLPPFHGERMRSYDGLIEEETLRAMASWPENEEFATLPTFNTITLRVILRAVFGAEGAELAELQTLLPPLTAVGQRLVTAKFLRRDLGPWSPGGRFKAMRSHFDRLVERLIEKHLSDPQLDERTDILALMIGSLRDAGEEIDRSAIGDELFTLLVAGHETTSSSLAWTVDRLRRHPDVLRRLEQEADGDSSALRTATVLEVQRHRPVITATARVAVKPFQLGQWQLPRGTVIVTAGSIMQADERFYPHATSFDPDRYLERKPDTYSWIPFGGGTRRCLGAAFALLEMDVVLRTMLRQFELLPASEKEERESFRGVAFAPAKGGRGRVRRRRRPLGEGSAAASADAACPVDHDVAAAQCPVEHPAPVAAER